MPICSGLHMAFHHAKPSFYRMRRAEIPYRHDINHLLGNDVK